MLEVRAPYDPAIAAQNISFTGRVSSGRANEVVEVQAKECRLYSAFRLIAGTRTSEGGLWAINRSMGFEIPLPPGSFRARWNGNYSRVVTVGTRLPLATVWDSKKRTASVSVYTGTDYNFHGRFVVLQRKTGLGWVKVRRARLVRQRDRAGLFVTVFRVPTRGLTLRVIATDATGAPCFTAAVSNSFRS
jgi:hypothetical protein